MDEQLTNINPTEPQNGQPPRIGAGDEFTRLKMHAAQLETIIDIIPEAIIITDPKGRILHINRAVEAIIGRPSTNIEPEDWPEKFGFYLDDAKTKYPGERMPLVRALHGERIEAEEMILRQADALNPIWITMSALPIQNESGESDGAIVLFRDITYRKQIELSRENHAKRMESLYKFSHAIAESGNDLNTITHVVAVHVAEYFGDASIVTLLNPNSDLLRIMAFHHPEPDARALLRKHIVLIDHELSESATGGVIQSGEPLLIPSLNPEQLEGIALPEFTDYILENEVQGYLVVPIIGRSGVLGTIGLFRAHGRKSYTCRRSITFDRYV